MTDASSFGAVSGSLRSPTRRDAVAAIGVVTVLALVGLPWALRDIWRRADRL